MGYHGIYSTGNIVGYIYIYIHPTNLIVGCVCKLEALIPGKFHTEHDRADQMECGIQFSDKGRCGLLMVTICSFLLTF